MYYPQLSLYLPDIEYQQKKYTMKKIILPLSAIILLLVLIVCLLPLFFKGSVRQWTENQISTQGNVKLEIGSMHAGLLKHFPHLHVTVKNAIVTDQAADTLASFLRAEATFQLTSLFGKKTVKVYHLTLEDARLQAEIDTAGHSVWKFLPFSSAPTSQATSLPSSSQAKSERTIQFPNITVKNLSIVYRDYRHSTYAAIGNLNFHLSNDLSADKVLSQIAIESQNMSFRQGNKMWFNQTSFHWQAEIAGDLQPQTFTIQESDLRINALPLSLQGEVAVLAPQHYRMDLALHALDSNFQHLLPLLPLLPEKQNLRTEGTFQFHATAKGEYTPRHLPALDINLSVQKAAIQYPELPEAIRHIGFGLQITNPGDCADSTRILLDDFSFDIAGNPFQMHLSVTNPVNPILDGTAKGTFDFAELKKALPIRNTTLEGSLNADMTFHGKYEYIEKEEYEKFTAKGSVEFHRIRLTNDRFPEGLSIPQGTLSITPAYLQLNRVKGHIYSSDFSVQGKIFNYLPYFFRGETLKGDFILNSQRINLNEFIIAQNHKRRRSISPQDTTSTPAQPSAADGALEIPRNVDINLTTQAGTVIFDRLTIQNIKGQITLANAVATLKNLRMDILHGNMTLDGKYNTRNPRTPSVDFQADLKNIDLREAYHAFTFVRKSLPVAAHCEGRLSATLSFAANLDQDMSPVMNTANGQGYLQSQGIYIHNNPAVNQLASVLKNDELRHLEISRFKIHFDLQDGNITVHPFQTSFAGNPVSIRGSQTVDGVLDYDLSMTLHRRFFGNDINNLLKAIPGADNIKTLDLDAKVSGTLDKPELKPDLSKAINAVTREAQKALKGNLLEGLQNLFKKK